MQKVEDGKIITFTQTIYSKAHGEWGTFERTIRFPDRLPPVMIEALINKSINDTMNIPRMENLDFEYEDSLNFSVPKAMLSGATEIKKGMVFAAKIEGRELQGAVKEINNDHIVIDCNFPHAGVKNLFNNLHILNIRDQTDEERLSRFDQIIKVI
jgi:FKBP-type peptidyl-prolyl cis-trans isomerase 2